MELALYHLRHGYYASGKARIGRNGDFFTNVSVGPIFGKLLAAQFAEIWHLLGRPARFTIVEQGAHDGSFIADVLTELRARWPKCYEAAKCILVEPFPHWQAQQAEKTAEFQPKIRWLDSLRALRSVTGVHFSNELFDAFPARRFEFNGQSWDELFVVEHDGNLCLERRPAVDVSLPKKGIAAQHRAEMSTEATREMREISRRMARGVILTIDYGYANDEFFSPLRREGTLQIRARHRRLKSPFELIGDADLSAHVNWTSLIDAGAEGGARLLGLIDQHHFFAGLLATFFEACDFSASEKRGLQTLLHPEMLGRSFQVLALGKNFNAPLAGFRFVRTLA